MLVVGLCISKNTFYHQIGQCNDFVENNQKKIKQNVHLVERRVAEMEKMSMVEIT